MPRHARDASPGVRTAAACRLGEEERRTFEAHLEGCDRCRDEVDGFRTAAAALGFADPEPAALDVRHRPQTSHPVNLHDAGNDGAVRSGTGSAQW